MGLRHVPYWLYRFWYIISPHMALKYCSGGHRICPGSAIFPSVLRPELR